MGSAHSPERGWDVYREIHKAIRFALFQVTTLAGATNASDDSAVRELLDEWADVRFVLKSHHAHENEHCDPLIQQHASEHRDDVEHEHRIADGDISHLDARAARMRAAGPQERVALLQQFHLDLADFTATYIAHLRFEEDVVMPALNRALSDATLAAVTARILASVPPTDLCVFLRYMMPAMNHAERVDLLTSMQAGVSPEVFEMYRSATESALPYSAYRLVAQVLGFS